jgi:uroporphyrinogen-III synthase
MGCDPVVAPLIGIRPLTPALPPADTFDGLVFTSPNGVAAFAALFGAGLPGVEAFRDRPVFAVGEATAAAAADAGWPRALSADGDVHDLARLIVREAAGLRLLAAGAETPSADLGALVGEAATVSPLAVYRAEPTDAAAPDAWDVVLIHSPRAGRELAARLEPVRGAGGRTLVAISRAAAAPLEQAGFARIMVASRPDEASLIETLKAVLGKPPADV